MEKLTVIKQSAKIKIFTAKQKQHYGMLGLQEHFDNPEMHPLVRYTSTAKSPGIPRHSRDLLWLGVLLMVKYPKVKFHMCYVPMGTLHL